MGWGDRSTRGSFGPAAHPLTAASSKSLLQCYIMCMAGLACCSSASTACTVGAMAAAAQACRPRAIGGRPFFWVLDNSLCDFSASSPFHRICIDIITGELRGESMRCKFRATSTYFRGHRCGTGSKTATMPFPCWALLGFEPAASHEGGKTCSPRAGGYASRASARE